MHREVHARNGNLFNEPDLFASGVPLPVDHPHSYRVVIDRSGLDYVIVREDVTVRGADPRYSTRPMTADQVASGLRGLARLHSLYWGFTTTTHPRLFLVGSLTIADRRSAEADLLKEYLAALDVPDETRPSFEDAWTHYRASASYGLAIWLSTLGTDGYQRREISLALAERYGAAYVDLDCELALAHLERT